MKITWINPDDIGTYDGRLFSSRACVRLRCIEPARYISTLGHDVRAFNIFHGQIWVNDPSFYASDVYVIGKAFVNIAPVLDRLRGFGKKIVIDVCDNIYEPPEDGLRDVYESIIPLADLVIASTPALAEILQDYAACRIAVIPDHVEGNKAHPCFDPDCHALKLLWFGYPNNLGLLYDCLPQFKTLMDMRAVTFTVVTSWNKQLLENFSRATCGTPTRCVNWSPTAMKHELNDCDIVIIPSSQTPARITKTANRVMTGLYAGKYVVAFPLPAYTEFSPFICLDEDLASGVVRSLDKPDEIRECIAKGQGYIDEHYSPELVSRRWHHALLNL